MAGSGIVHGVCQEIDEAVFTLRMAVPATWQGSAASAFAQDVEGVAAELARTSSGLHSAIALLRWQEQHLRTLSAALGWGG